jgi:glycosyltransferase involved in cell wall biosynthesis
MQKRPAPRWRATISTVPAPFISIVIPAYNEEACIDQTLADVVAELNRLGQAWEVLVVDDGSTDRTREIVSAWQAADFRVRLIAAPHLGKGGAVRRGMLEAGGAWRFLADADLSMPIHELARFLPGPGVPVADMLIGSREAAGARRIEEPWHRHALGRVFNLAAKILVVGGISDTQCGYKLFSAGAATTLFPLQRLDGFGFDCEILFLARRAGFTVREIPVTWTYRTSTKVTALAGGDGFVDLLRVRWNQLRGRYSALAGRRAA